MTESSISVVKNEMTFPYIAGHLDSKEIMTFIKSGIDTSWKDTPTVNQMDTLDPQGDIFHRVLGRQWPSTNSALGN